MLGSTRTISRRVRGPIRLHWRGISFGLWFPRVAVEAPFPCQVLSRVLPFCHDGAIRWQGSWTRVERRAPRYGNWHPEWRIDTVHSPLAGIAGDWHLSWTRPGSLAWMGMDFHPSRSSGSYIVEPHRISTVGRAEDPPKGERDRGGPSSSSKRLGVSQTHEVPQIRRVKNESDGRVRLKGGVCVWVGTYGIRIVKSDLQDPRFDEDQWSNSCFFSVEFTFLILTK